MAEKQIRKAWANVESLAGTSDYCKYGSDSQDLKDIELIGKLVEKEAEQQDKIEYLQNSLDEMTKDRDEWKEKFYEEYSQR